MHFILLFILAIDAQQARTRTMDMPITVDLCRQMELLLMKNKWRLMQVQMYEVCTQAFTHTHTHACLCRCVNFHSNTLVQHWRLQPAQPQEADSLPSSQCLLKSWVGSLQPLKRCSLQMKLGESWLVNIYVPFQNKEGVGGMCRTINTYLCPTQYTTTMSTIRLCSNLKHYKSCLMKA